MSEKEKIKHLVKELMYASVDMAKDAVRIMHVPTDDELEQLGARMLAIKNEIHASLDLMEKESQRMKDIIENIKRLELQKILDKNKETENGKGYSINPYPSLGSSESGK